ncbi:glycoside hydrolase family 9 protein [Cellulomonas cellasea]|uniref:glycoside hydrolase family 9 protein n=1 Tax=Cellulomonas cellasea TaxID=43670 RepID=UPI0025A4CC0B|nr:glycoside hydrolase family 9 protein [Cellulomonas cellasea]MDM8083584.1 glycoside hydrolase family 9 protein [Cellulomonas cellasea]
MAAPSPGDTAGAALAGAALAGADGRGPRIRVNQLGCLPGVPAHATLVTGDQEPLPWTLERDGAVLTRGMTSPRGHDASAGLDVHTIDVGPVGVEGDGFMIRADGATSDPFAIRGDLYEVLARDAVRFFHLQRSGVEIGPEVAGEEYARPAGHVAGSAHGGDTRVPCLPAGRAVTADGVDLYDGWTDDHVLDVSGGWYDAGDQGKYVVNGGIAVAQLLGVCEWVGAAVELPAGLERALRDEARWELEWLLRMQVPAGQRYAGLAHHKVADERWTPIPTLPHEDPQPRHLHRPSTAAALNLAAAAAQGARVFAAEDPEFATRLLAVARSAHAAALRHPDLLAPNTNVLANGGSGPYDDTDLEDEWYWAAVELYVATGEQQHLDALRANGCHVGGPVDVFADIDWQRVGGLARLHLALVPSGLPQADADAARASVVDAADAILAVQAAQPFGHPYAPPDGRYDWGSNGLLLNQLTVLGAAWALTGEARLRDGLAQGMDYVLGRNALGISYVTGHGARSAHNQHSRWYAHQADPSLPCPPPGSLSGGPNSATPDPVSAALVAGLPAQQCFVDDIGAYGVNELTINWNAPLAQVSALLAGVLTPRRQPAPAAAATRRPTPA